MVGIMDALSNEFYKMGTFSDDYYRDVITPYKEGVKGKPGFLQSMKNWQPWRAFMPQSMGGTFYTKPTPMASTALRAAGRFPLAAFASEALGGPRLLSGDTEVRAGRDFTPSQPNSAVNEYAAGRGSQPTFSRPSANRDFTQTDYGKAYQRGGSVNPHEETARAAREWSPRDQYISRSNQDRMHDATVNRFIQEGQSNQQRWEQGGGQGAYPVFNDPGADYSPPITQGWMEASSGLDNSGVMLAMANNSDVNQMKNNYFGHRLFDTGWGQGLLNRWANKWGDEDTLEAVEGLPDLGDKRRWLGADWDFDIGREDDGGWKYGIDATWPLGG